MAIVYTWTINEMFTYPQMDGLADVVFGVSYTLSGMDEEYSTLLSGNVPLGAPGSDFTPYPDLTEAEVIGWVQSELGPDQIAAFEAQIVQAISEQKTPTVVINPLPWT